MPFMAISMSRAVCFSHIILDWPAVTMFKIFTMRDIGQAKVSNKLVSTMPLLPLLLSVTTLSGVDSMKPWDKNKIISSNTLKDLLKDCRVKHQKQE